MTYYNAREELRKSVEIADKLHASVYTIFRLDMLTNETSVFRAMFDNAVEGRLYIENKINSLKSLGVPYAIYLYDKLESAQGDLKFDSSFNW